MSRPTFLSLLKPLFIAFILINILCFAFAGWLDGIKINHLVLAGSNMLLFILSILITFLNMRAAANNNPNVFMRSVMAGIFIKMIVIAIAAVIYLLSAGDDRSVLAVALSMVWYAVYTVIEVKTALRINKNQHAKN